MTPWPELVELYEYKVADALEGRVPRGGRRSMGELRETLLGGSLEPALLRRVVEVDRQYRAHLKATSGEVQVARTRPTTATPWLPPVNTDSGEMRAWEDLQRLTWTDRMRAALRELTAGWYREPNLLTLRVLYTALENAERAQQVSASPLPVPSASDPLVNLHDPEVLQRINVAFVELMATLEGRTRLRTALSNIHEEPYPRHPDEDVVAARVAAVERDNLTAETKGALIHALKEQYQLNRDYSERPKVREAVRLLVEALEPLLSTAPTPLLGGIPNHSILYAEQPRSALGTPDDGADELVIHLRGGQAARWRGVDLRWQYFSPNWQVQVNQQVVLLRPLEGHEGRIVTIPLPNLQFKAMISGAYLLLRAMAKPEDELRRRASLGRAVALLLDPTDSFAYLRLARASAQLLRDGQVDAQGLDRDSGLKYQAASQDVLLTFARKGAETLCGRLTRVEPHEAAAVLRNAAQALKMNPLRAANLNEALTIATYHMEVLPAPVSESRVELPPTGEFVSVQVRDEPLTLQVGHRAVTLRMDFKGELAAVIPGHAAQTLRDLLVFTIPDATVILARHGTWVAASARAVRGASQWPGGDEVADWDGLLDAGPPVLDDTRGAAPDPGGSHSEF